MMAFEVHSSLADVQHQPEMLPALGLYTLAGSWSSYAKENGWVPEDVVRQWDPRLRCTTLLVEHGLWTAGEHRDGEFGYQFVIGEVCRFASVRAPIPPALRAAVYERDRHTCQHCGATDRLSLDHIVPWSRGGPDTFENLQTLCTPCNSSKGARLEVAHGQR